MGASSDRFCPGGGGLKGRNMQVVCRYGVSVILTGE